MPHYWIEASFLGLSIISLGFTTLALRRMAKLEKMGGTLDDHIRRAQNTIHQAQATINTLKDQEQTMHHTLNDTLKRATLMVQDLDFLCHRGQTMADMLEKFSEALGAMYRTKQSSDTTPDQTHISSVTRIAS